MHIAYVTGEYPRVTDTFIQREVAALRQYGSADGTLVHTFSVRSPQAYDALSPDQKEESDRTSYLLPVKPIELIIAHWLLLIAQPQRYVRALALAWKTRQIGIRGILYQLIYFLEAGILAQRLRRLKVSHLHNHFGDSSGTVTMLAAALGDFSYSFTLHGPGIFFEPHRWRLDEKISRAKFVSCISYFCRSQAMIFAPLTAWPKLHIIHCGVDPQTFAQKPSSEEAIEKSFSPLQLLFVGRLAAAKGLPVLLQSLVVLKLKNLDVRLTVIGDGEDRAELESQVEALGLETCVNFVGYQSSDAVRGYLQAADVFVMSSFAEGVPVVLMEAMMAGVPVVATQVGGVSELVEEGVNGFLVPPSDVQTLTERIRCLLADGDLRRRLGAQGRLKVSEDFNIYSEAKKLYQLMISATPSAALLDPRSDPPQPLGSDVSNCSDVSDNASDHDEASITLKPTAGIHR
ncbi:MAG: glycosyltransferase [Phormidesmis sp.]